MARERKRAAEAKQRAAALAGGTAEKDEVDSSAVQNAPPRMEEPQEGVGSTTLLPHEDSLEEEVEKRPAAAGAQDSDFGAPAAAASSEAGRKHEDPAEDEKAAPSDAGGKREDLAQDEQEAKMDEEETSEEPSEKEEHSSSAEERPPLCFPNVR